MSQIIARIQEIMLNDPMTDSDDSFIELNELLNELEFTYGLDYVDIMMMI